MTAAIVVYILIVTLPLVGAAALAERVCRTWSWPVRGAWAAMALAVVSLGGRTVARQMIAPEPAQSITPIHIAQAVDHVTQGTMARVGLAAERLLAFPQIAATYAARTVGPSQDRILAVLWIGMSLSMLAFAGFVYLRVWRVGRAWETTELAGQRVRVAPNVGPAVVGIFRPEIVVPHWILESELEVSQLIVMHEMEHRNARDPLLLAAMWMFIVLIPWHPGAWYCLARTRLAIELDCDARVVTRGASLKLYAQLLLNQARARLSAPTQLWLGATSLLESPSHLERRLTAMMTPGNSTHAPRSVARLAARYARTLSGIAVVSALVFVACESHVPTAADISGLDATSAEKNARQATLIDGQHMVYYVNDAPVSAESARAILAANISSITIVAPNKTSGQQEIRITSIGAPIVGDSVAALKEMTFPVPLTRATVVSSSAVHGKEFRAKFPRKLGQMNPAVITIDGVASTATAMNALNPHDIATMEIIKGPAALKESTDSLAKNGLIRITLKH